MAPRQLLMLLVLAALWGGSFPAIKAAVDGLGPIGVAGGRVALAALALGAVLVLLRPKAADGTAGWPSLRQALLVGGLNVALPFALISAAETELPASLASVLNATVPVFGALVGALALGERVTAWRVAGLALGLVGVALCVGLSDVPLDAPALLASGAMLAAAASYAVAGHYVKRRVKGVAPLRLATAQLTAATALLAVALPLVPPPGPVGGEDLGALVYLAVPATAVAYLLYFRLLDEVGTTNTMTVTFLVPPFGVVFSAVLLGEGVGLGLLVGGAVVLLGVALVTEVLPRRVPPARAAATTPVAVPGPDAAAPPASAAGPRSAPAAPTPR